MNTRINNTELNSGINQKGSLGLYCADPTQSIASSNQYLMESMPSANLDKNGPASSFSSSRNERNFAGGGKGKNEGSCFSRLQMEFAEGVSDMVLEGFPEVANKFLTE